MGKKILIITLCLLLIVSSQLTSILFVSPLTAEAASCGTANYPVCVQDLTQANWKDDTTNGFEVSGIDGNDGISLFRYNNDPNYPAGYYFDADERATPKSIKILAGEGFAGGVFDLQTLTIDTTNKHNEDGVFTLSIQGLDTAGNPKGSPVSFSTVKYQGPVYNIPVHLQGINAFVITVSVQYIDTVQAGLWDLTFTQFTIDIPANNPPTVSTGAITASNITATGVTLDWAKAFDDITAQENLAYRVYQSSSNNMDTVEAIEANGTPLENDYTKDIHSFNVTGLTANTTYYFNIIVQDADGNKSAYTTQQVTTLPLNRPPTSSNGTVNVNEGQVYIFNSASFAFHDEDAGDTLQHIQIVTIPNSGQLYLDNNNNQQIDAGEALANGATISKIDLDAGKLKYLTESSSSTSFLFTVSDGMDASDAYTMSLAVSTRPAVTISSAVPSPTNSNPIPISIVFSESVTGFTLEDIVITNGTVQSLIGGGTLYVAQIVPSADGTVKIQIPENIATTSSGAFNQASIEFEIISDRTPPTDIMLSNSTVQEKKSIGTTVGTLTATDSGGPQAFTYSLVSGDTNFFEIDGNELKTTTVFTYDTKNNYQITIRATDEAGNTFEKELTIEITKNHPPIGSITINNGAGYTSSTNVILTMTASDTEGEAITMRFSNDGTTWSSWESYASTKGWTLTNGDGSKTIYMQLKDTADNISNTLSNTIILDTTPPVITGVTNSGVYNTDVTISFNEGTATLNGATFTNGATISTSGNYTVVVTDSAGNTTTITFVIDKTPPQATGINIQSSHADPTKAKIGDTITLTVETDKNIQAPVVTIAENTAIVTGSSRNWQATYVIEEGDIEGAVPFTLNFQDLLGNSAVEVTEVTDGSYVIADSTKPALDQVTMTSNNANPAVAKVGDIITIDIVASEDIQLPLVTIQGQPANVHDQDDGDAKTWQASYTLQSGDADGAVYFTIDFQDLAGNLGSQVTEVSAGAIVIIDKNPPQATTYSPAHQAMDIEPTDNLVLTFDKSVVPVAGKNIVIRNASDSQIIETIEATQANVSVAANIVTINPTMDFAHQTMYSVEIDAGAFIDLAGNAYEGIVDRTMWNFTTKAQATYTITYIGNGAEGGTVPIDSKQYQSQATITVLGNTGNLMKAGYTFVGWNTQADGKGTTYKAGQTMQMGKAHVVLFALWSKNSVPNNNGGSSTSPPSPDPMTPNDPSYVSIVDPNNPDKILARAIITREDNNGSLIDTINVTANNLEELLQQFMNREDKRFTIVIPDLEPSANETRVILAKEAVERLAEGKLNFGITMGTVKIDIPFTSIADFNEAIYFYITPVKDTLLQNAIEERAQQGNDSQLALIGQPITITTNLQNRNVTLLLPLPINLPSIQQEHILVYVEHSNDTSEFLHGHLAEFNREQAGIVFDVQHFSTFLLVYKKQQDELEQEPIELEKKPAPYIQGYDDGTFRPNAKVTRAQMAAMLARNLSDNHIPAASQLFYTDIANSWAKNDIEYIRTKGMMQGYDNQLFGPNDGMTRAQMAVIAVRWIDQQCLKEPATTSYCDSKASDKKYSDVASMHWAKQEIDRISEMGIMLGFDNGQFKPEEKLTRAQAVKVLNRIFNRSISTEQAEPIFKDIPTDHWAFFDIQAAAQP
ncbi:S-layer homology domain-containing protein [Lysinibacillus sp. FSL K6-0232]|uniref:S-layer homology domain-containing protein n=1 Tax=Lysinibacillus sp. FSL K6-0232 TaxID=2921425 RepID=UPI0030FA0700